METVTENIFRFLKETKKTQASLAAACGIDVHTVSRWKTINSVPQSKQIEKIAEFFGVSVDLLYKKNASLKKSDYGFLKGKWEATEAFCNYLKSIGIDVEWDDFIPNDEDSELIGTIVKPSEVKITWKDIDGEQEERIVSATQFDSLMKRYSSHLKIDIEEIY